MNLSAAHSNNLIGKLSEMSVSYGKTITYRTMFSGSDVLNPTLKHLSQVWLDSYGKDVEFKQMFLIEKDGWKRDLSGAHWNSGHQFADALTLEAEGPGVP